MGIILQFIKSVIWVLPFVLLCLSNRKANLNKADRGYQFLMPLITVIYCVIALLLLNDLNNMLVKLVKYVAAHVPFLSKMNLIPQMTYIFNTALVAGFLIVKGICLPILKRIWSNSPKLMEVTSGKFYTYEEDIDKWLLDKEYGQVKFYYAGIYYAAVTVSSLLFVFSKTFPKEPAFKAVFYPTFGILILGEVVNYLSGITKSEFVEDILGEDEESYKIANYGMLREILKDLFGNRVLYDATMDNGLEVSTEFETLEEMQKSEDSTVCNLGKYFNTLKENGEDIDANYVKSCVKLIQGQSTLFCNPFYRDLTPYIMLPIVMQLMKYRKCLIIMGRDSSTDDVKEWIEQGILDCVHTDSLWKTEILTRDATEADIGIVRFSDLYNLEIQKSNTEFLSRVGFVFLVEPSRILTTGQVGLSLLVNQFNDEKAKIVYSACDRNCDGLVDSLSHTLKTNITEVTATLHSGLTTSLMSWKADGEYMHHKIFPNISRYLGMGTEINAVAMKYQIANTKWISSDKFPVLDMKWIAGQYYKKICDYANLSVSQNAFNKAFQVEENLWDIESTQNAYLVVEDEFQNLFELVRVFSTRAKQQGFLNVISENYLLRDYMLANVQTFMTDPKAIPTIVADYARTERNTILKLIMRMTEEQVSEDEIAQIFMVSAIQFDNVLDTLKALIRKHCFIDNINIRIYFREKLMEDALRTEVKKYYTIEEETEIAEYARNLRNAYYIAEDEKGETHYIGAKLYGHVFQALIPGQFLTFAGKYYEVQSITPENGVVLRRAADHITDRKYYRQLRHIVISDWKNDESVGGQKTIEDIRISKGYCQIEVNTGGYLEMSSYEDLKTARTINVNGIPQRLYRNKLVMKIQFPGADERIRYTICLLLNEIFKTTYPETYPYICAVTPLESAEELKHLKDAMYTMESDYDDNAIYIVEDSEIDLGLIVSVERNLERYFGIITEILTWHELKMVEKPKKEPEKGEVPEFAEEMAAPVEKQTFWGKVISKVKAFWGKIVAKFKKQPKPEEPEAEEPAVEEPTAEAPVEEEPTGEEQTAEAPVEEEPTVEEASTEADATEDSPADTVKESPADDVVMQSRSILRSQNEGTVESEGSVDIEGEDEEVEEIPEEPTEYQKHCFLKFGYEDFEEFLDFKGTVSYLTEYGYNQNPLSQVRDQEHLAEEYEKGYDPHKAGVHFCDFCGVELVGGEYELLHDGRERCNRCSATALRTGEEFKEVFKTVMRHMELFYGIKFNVAIRVRMTDAKKIARHLGEEFVATPGFDGRTLGFAEKDSTGYSIYVENGSPKLAAMATIAHELTHIWQYQNWDDKKIVQKYGVNNRLEIYEGMAKWAEIQYLYCLNEVAYAKRQEILTQLRDDEYGRGFIRYRANYPFTIGNVITRATPFNNPEEPLDPAFCGKIDTAASHGRGASFPMGRQKKSGWFRWILVILLLAFLIGGINSCINDGKDKDAGKKQTTIEKDKIDDKEKDDKKTDDKKADDKQTEDDLIDKKQAQNAPRYGYETLSAEEKEVYDCLYDSISKFEPEVTEFPHEFEVEKIHMILRYIMEDCPELFWFQGGGLTYSDQVTKMVTKHENTYCMSQSEAEKRQTEIDAAVNKILAGVEDSMSEYDKTVYFYDSIIQSIDYDGITYKAEEAKQIVPSPTVPDNARSIYGVFVEKKAVCMGYARAMQYLLNKEGMECILVENETHAWNIVKLDGEYYHVDATWGDHTNNDPEFNTSTETDYTFMGLTSAEIQGVEDYELKVETYPLPECTATELNYYRKNGLFVEAYDYEKIKSIILKSLKDGNYKPAFKCSSEAVFTECKNMLVDGQMMSKIIEEINASEGMNVDGAYLYYDNNGLDVMMFELKNK